MKVEFVGLTKLGVTHVTFQSWNFKVNAQMTFEGLLKFKSLLTNSAS